MHTDKIPESEYRMAVFIFVLLVINMYTIVYWSHPEDKNDSYVARALILIGLQLCSMCVLMLPIDVANNGGNPACDPHSTSTVNGVYCGHIDFLLVWESLFSMICFFVVVLIPFALFYYESEDDSAIFSDVTKTGKKKGKKKLKKEKQRRNYSKFYIALSSTMVSALCFLAILLGLFYTINSTYIPVDEFSFSLSNLENIEYENPSNFTGLQIIQQFQKLMVVPESSFDQSMFESTQYVSFPVTFPIYVMAVFGWFGWWFFAMFGGIGLAAIPASLIVAYVWRPVTMSPEEYHHHEVNLQDRTNDLLEITLLLKKERLSFAETGGSVFEKRKRIFNDRIEVNRLVQMVYVLERDVEELRPCKPANAGQSNPLVPIAQLVAGIFFAAISIMWQLQIILSMLSKPAVSPFLSTFFISFDSWFPMFGNLSYALFSMYLMFCTIMGCFKFGMAFMCIKIHPMKPHGTYINSFLFNLGILLICTIPVVQFCATACRDYAQAGDIFMLFGVQVFYLGFFEKFTTNNVFVYMLLISSYVAVVAILWRPRPVATSAEMFKKSLADRGESGYSINIINPKSKDAAKKFVSKLGLMKGDDDDDKNKKGTMKERRKEKDKEKAKAKDTSEKNAGKVKKGERSSAATRVEEAEAKGRRGQGNDSKAGGAENRVKSKDSSREKSNARKARERESISMNSKKKNMASV